MPSRSRRMFARLAKRVHLFSKNPPRSSPLALAWELDHRAHPSLEDFLGKRTPRCIGPREPVETKSPRGRGGLFIDSQRRTSNGTRCALPNRSHPSTRLVTEDQGGRLRRVIMSMRNLTTAARRTLGLVPLQRYWLTMRGGGGLAQTAWPLMRPCRTSRRLRIPTQSGRGFRFDVGRRSDLMSATIPK